MDKELTPIQQQVIKSIEKSIEKDLKDIEALGLKLSKDEQSICSRIQSLKDQLSDIRGIYSANKELLEMSIDKAKKALEVFVGDAQEEKVDTREIERTPAVVKPTKVATPTITPQKEIEIGSDEHKKHIDDQLPWTVIDDDTVDEEMPFKGIFSKK